MRKVVLGTVALALTLVLSSPGAVAARKSPHEFISASGMSDGAFAAVFMGDFGDTNSQVSFSLMDNNVYVYDCTWTGDPADLVTTNGAATEASATIAPIAGEISCGDGPAPYSLSVECVADGTSSFHSTGNTTMIFDGLRQTFHANTWQVGAICTLEVDGEYFDLDQSFITRSNER